MRAEARTANAAGAPQGLCCSSCKLLSLKLSHALCLGRLGKWATTSSTTCAWWLCRSQGDRETDRWPAVCCSFLDPGSPWQIRWKATALALHLRLPDAQKATQDFCSWSAWAASVTASWFPPQAPLRNALSRAVLPFLQDFTA